MTKKEERQAVERTRRHLERIGADDLANEYADRKEILRGLEPEVIVTYPAAGLPKRVYQPTGR